MFRIHGLGRKSWTGKDPGGRLGNIAVRKRNCKELKLSDGDMRRLTSEAGTRGSPPFSLVGGTRGVWQSQDSDLGQLPVLTLASM